MSALAFNLAAASFLLLVVLAVRRPVAAAFGPRAAYALWLAPLVRLVIPPFDLPSAAAPLAAGAGDSVEWVALRLDAAEAPALATLLLAAWATGAAAMLAVHLIRHYRFVRRALATGRPLMVDGVSADLVATPAVGGPMATGLVHPIILVPDDFAERFSPEQRRLALLHEQMHHSRGDIWASAAALAGASALWFNPFAHLALGAFRRDMEAACDASLVAAAGRQTVPAYAETILASAARPVPRSLCALTSIDELKGRLTMLNANHGAGLRLAGLGLAGLVTIAGLALPAPATAQGEKKQETIEKRVIIHEGDSRDGTRKRHGDMKADCPGKLTEVEAAPQGTGEKKEKAKIVICSKSGSNAEAAEGLEKALARIAENDEMDPAVKADLTARLKAKIAELRAGQ
jgi:bla regulator protein BlaR1